MAEFEVPEDEKNEDDNADYKPYLKINLGSAVGGEAKESFFP